ncbi:MAG: hypothetical protein MJZ28_08925 [Paludibacteraceae bacterium]|nr:hypothetical protein [Paludibacteraceae bacterium]
MNNLIETYKLLIDRVNIDFVHYLHDKINWNNRLIAILGAKDDIEYTSMKEIPLWMFGFLY